MSWRWKDTTEESFGYVQFSENLTHATFHKDILNATVAIRGDTPLIQNHLYYWEVQILSHLFNDNMVIGVGRSDVELCGEPLENVSIVGCDNRSYGLSNRGCIRHNQVVSRASDKYSRGDIVGVKVDFWQGVIEFFINRQRQGVALHNLRQHDELYPMICSKEYRSSLRLLYASSCESSLLITSAKILFTVTRFTWAELPPGLRFDFRKNFWLTLSSDDDLPVGVCVTCFRARVYGPNARVVRFPPKNPRRGDHWYDGMNFRRN